MEPDLMLLHEATQMCILNYTNYKLMESYMEKMNKMNRWLKEASRKIQGGEEGGSKDQNQSYCFVSKVSECGSVEEQSNESTINPQKNTNSSSARKKKSNATVNALKRRSSTGKKAVCNGFVLKKWNVVLKGNNLALVGSLYDMNGQELNRSHVSKPILSRKLDGSVSTIDGIYVLDGAPVWQRPTDPHSAVKKLFLRRFPIKWRQAVELWKLELCPEKREKPSLTISKSAPSNSSKNNILPKGRGQKTEYVTSAKVAGKNKHEEKDKSSSEETIKDNQASDKHDMFARLDLDIPRLAFTSATPSTLVEAITKNAVRIGAHTPTLKTFTDGHPDAFAESDSPDEAPSKPKKVDVVSSRLANAIRDNGKAINGIIQFEEKKTVGTTKIIREIEEGLDDTDSLGESDRESEILTSD